MKIAIVKYNAGNIFSVENALKRLGVNPILTDDVEELASADKVLFPGQGKASVTMSYLRAHRLDEVLVHLTQPVLGICIGQQLMCRHSAEGDVDCLGIFPIDVERFLPENKEDKVPAMGWNQLNIVSDNPLFKGLGEQSYAYFVHSYYVPTCKWTTAEAYHILPFSACLGKDNFYATQFHPEKSGKTGEIILNNFLNL